MTKEKQIQFLAKIVQDLIEKMVIYEWDPEMGYTTSYGFYIHQEDRDILEKIAKGIKE